METSVRSAARRSRWSRCFCGRLWPSAAAISDFHKEEVGMVRGGFRRWLVLGFVLFVAACFESAYAQAPTGRGGAAAAPQPRVCANMLQLMRRTRYPPCNRSFHQALETTGD